MPLHALVTRRWIVSSASISSCRSSASCERMLKAGDVIPITIEKPAAGGAMIGRHEGQVVLVSGAIPGERVRVRMVRVSKSVAHGEPLAIDEPSPDRRAV